MPAFRITNISNIATKTRGHFLDMGSEHQNKSMSVGGQLVLEAKSFDLLPACVLGWRADGLVRVVNLDDGAEISPAFSGELTPKSVNRFNEVNSEDEFDAEPNLDEAVPARVPTESTGAMAGDISQMVKISDAAAEERYSTDMSPFPGEKAKSVDDNEQFTIRAPKSGGPGSVVRTR